MMSPADANALMEWQPVSSRIMAARFKSKGRKATIIKYYAPTNDADEGNILQHTANSSRRTTQEEHQATDG